MLQYGETVICQQPASGKWRTGRCLGARLYNYRINLFISMVIDLLLFFFNLFIVLTIAYGLDSSICVISPFHNTPRPEFSIKRATDITDLLHWIIIVCCNGCWLYSQNSLHINTFSDTGFWGLPLMIVIGVTIGTTAVAMANCSWH